MKRKERLGFDSKQISQKARKRTGRLGIQSAAQTKVKRGEFYGKKWYPEKNLS